jgi:type III secretory pathway component EscT
MLNNIFSQMKQSRAVGKEIRKVELDALRSNQPLMIAMLLISAGFTVVWGIAWTLFQRLAPVRPVLGFIGLMLMIGWVVVIREEAAAITSAPPTE